MHKQAGKGAENKEHAMYQNRITAIATVGVDFGKNSFHMDGLA